MSQFDERAEATAERPGDKGGPSRAEIRRVRRALATSYRTLENNLSSIDVLLNLQGGPNANSENGPPAVGSHDNQIAVTFMGRVADNIRQIRTAVTAVEFDAGDKQKFRLALKEMAAAWDLRAKALGSTDVNRTSALLKQVKEAEQRGNAAKRGLQRYLPRPDLEELEEREEELESE